MPSRYVLLVLAAVAGAVFGPADAHGRFSNEPWAEPCETALIRTQIQEEAMARAAVAVANAAIEGAPQPTLEGEALSVMREVRGNLWRSWNLKHAVVLTSLKFKLTKFEAAKLYVQARQYLVRETARNLYRPALDATHAAAVKVAKFARDSAGVSMSLAWLRWRYVEGLFNKGKDEASFGAENKVGMVTVLNHGPPSDQDVQATRQFTRAVGQPLKLDDGTVIPIKPYLMSHMISISGMSYPQLSVNSVLTLLYIHIRLAKQGIRHVYDTGEGGPHLHLALLDRSTSKEHMVDVVTRYAIDSGIATPFSIKHAEISTAVDRIMRDRDELFKEFSDDDLNLAQIRGQLATMANGARNPEGGIDLDTVTRWAKYPFYAGTQIKFSQAAKFGAKVSGSKVNELSAYLRKTKPGLDVDAPPANMDWKDDRALARTILMLKMATGKPVSLKFAVGQINYIYDKLAYLRDMGALPDHIQLDGAGFQRLPGSGNAPIFDNSNLKITTAVVAVDAILKKLGVRDQVQVDATGDILTPHEALMGQALGADGVAAARLWMGMGLGCMLMHMCAQGTCYRGIAAKDGGLFAEGLDPKELGPRGFKAALAWFNSYTKLRAASGASAETPIRAQHGLNQNTPIVVNDGLHDQPLDQIFTHDYLYSILGTRLSRGEVHRLIFGTKPAPDASTAEGARGRIENQLSED